MNFLEIAEENRPLLETRQREGAAHPEVQCPVCGTFRPAFCIAEVTGDMATALGSDWACDGDITKFLRENPV